MPELPALRAALATFRSTGAHITEAQLEAAWTEYEDVRSRLLETVAVLTDAYGVSDADRAQRALGILQGGPR